MRLTENHIQRIVRFVLNETIEKQGNEQILNDLFDYLAKNPTDDIYDYDDNGRRSLNTRHKAYNYFEPKAIVHDVWAIHYTNAEAYEGIMGNGFIKGVTNYDELAYTPRVYDDDEVTDKIHWNFALPIDNEYLGEDLGYGDCAFLIKTDGVRAYHKGDHDDEIIFCDSMVKAKIPFAYDEDFKCWILTDGSDVYEGGCLPKGAYYHDELERVVFKDVHSLIKFVISRYSRSTSI